MAQILSVNTPLLWLCGTLQMELVDRRRRDQQTVDRLAGAQGCRRAIRSCWGSGLMVWRLRASVLNLVVDKQIAPLAQAGSAGGIDRARHQPVPVRSEGGEKLGITV